MGDNRCVFSALFIATVGTPIRCCPADAHVPVHAGFFFFYVVLKGLVSIGWIHCMVFIYFPLTMGCFRKFWFICCLMFVFLHLTLTNKQLIFQLDHQEINCLKSILFSLLNHCSHMKATRRICVTFYKVMSPFKIWNRRIMTKFNIRWLDSMSCFKLLIVPVNITAMSQMIQLATSTFLNHYYSLSFHVSALTGKTHYPLQCCATKPK